jgi:hypothetical protein
LSIKSQKLNIALLALLLICKAGFAFAAMHEQDIEDLAYHPRWLAMLHYDAQKSLISDHSFFLAENGNTNPVSELLATIQRMRENNMLACRFPARARFLERSLGRDYDFLSATECPDFQEFLENVAVKKIYFVFATESLHSPLSSMGHAFLKIDGERDGRTPRHSASFFANLNEAKNPVTFIPKALFTGANGLYMLEPYKDRAYQYQQVEKRDLVEVPLEMQDWQRRFLIDHLWELKDVTLSYNLSSYNCASALIRLLMVADPGYKKILYKAFITPADIIQELEKTEDNPGIARMIADLPVKTSRASQIEMYFGRREGRDFINFTYSPAYNDVMGFNHVLGQELDIKLFTADFSYFPEENRARLNEIILFKSQNFRPARNYKNISRSLEFSVQNRMKNNLRNDWSPFIAGGAGYALSYFNALKPYIFIKAGYDQMESNSSLFMSPEAGIFVYLGEKQKFHAQYRRKFNLKSPHHEDKYTLGYALQLAKNFGLRAHYEDYFDYSSMKAGFYWNF